MENSLDRECSIASSGGSTPEPPVPFCPKFNVSFTNNISKDGKSIKYRIHVSQNDEIIQVIERDYENFEYLHHCVTTDQPYQGLIIPPLPCKLAADAYSAEAFTKKQMGKSSKTLLGDDFKRQSFQLQIYLELLLSHPVLGKSPRLQEFLLSRDPPPKTKVRQNLVNKLSASLEARKTAYPDCDDFFQKERYWISKYMPAVENFSSTFAKIMYSEIRFAYQLEEISAALKHQCFSENHSSEISNLNRIFLHYIDVTKNELEEKTSFEDTNAEIAKQVSEEAFEKCTDDARKEVRTISTHS
ncbi:Sorting nexin-32, partial [Armadillidium nasatum]